MPSVASVLAWSAIGVPTIAYLIRRHLLRPGVEPFVFMLACIASYGFLFASLPFREHEIEAAMLVHDMDGNGIVGSTEMTDAAKRAVDRWQHDTGRNFAPFTGLILVPLWCLITYATLALIHWPLRLFRTRSHGG